MSSNRSKLVTVAAVGAAALSAAAIAGAASSGTTTSTPAAAPTAPQSAQPHNPSQSGHTVNGKTETLLTGTVEAKVRAAALAKVPGTVERVETNVDSSAPYEAHIIKSDGTEVEVQVNSDYTVARSTRCGPPVDGRRVAAWQ
jgi:uncharacterized membrane protein YkoI